MPASLFAGLIARARAKRTSVHGGNSNANNGRTGAQGPAANNAPSSDFQFTDTSSSANVKSYVLRSDTDIVRATFTLSVTATGNSTSADITGAIQQIQILGPAGPLVTMTPMPDFYNFGTRFSPLHNTPAQVISTVATVISGTWVVYGLNLPALANGVYTMSITTQTAATFNTSVTALSVVTTLQLGFGNCGGKTTHYAYSGLPFTPAVSGVNDLAPLASIQGKNLIELFLYGFTATTGATPDLAYVQIQSKGGVLGPRITTQELISVTNAEINGNLISTAESVSAGSVGRTPLMFMLFPLKTTLVLGNGAHCYFNWGTSTPSTTIIAGYYWLE